MSELWRVGNRQPQNVYYGAKYVGVMFTPGDAAFVVAAANAADPGALVARAVEIEDEHNAWERGQPTLVSIVALIQAALVEVGLPTDTVHVSVAMGRRPSASIHRGEPGRRYAREEAERLGRALGLTDAEWTGQGEPDARIETREGHTPDGVRFDIHCEAEATS